jgi:SAM-dependent methyltransferase
MELSISDFIHGLYRVFFNRAPDEHCLRRYTQMLNAGLAPHELVSLLLKSAEHERLGVGRSHLSEMMPEDSAGTKVSYADWRDLYIRVGDWDRLYRAGECDWAGIGELPHYAMVAGYVHKLAKEGILLDAGCGEATLTDYLDPQKVDYLGFDISAIAVERANNRIPRGYAIEASFDAFSPPDDIKFDAIVFNGSLQYTATPFEIIDKYRSFLKYGGIIIVGVYQANKDLLFGKLLQEACNQGRYAIVDIAYAASVSDDLAWRIFVLK